jgi:hypothetical protein
LTRNDREVGMVGKHPVAHLVGVHVGVDLRLGKKGDRNPTGRDTPDCRSDCQPASGNLAARATTIAPVRGTVAPQAQ